MYRTYYLNSRNFSFMHLCDSQAEVRKVYTGAHACLDLIFLKFLFDDAEQSFILFMRYTDAENLVHCFHPRACAEDDLVSHVELTEQILACGKQHRNGADSDKTAPEEWSMMICRAIANSSTSNTVFGVW